MFGALSRDRTCDRLLKRELLYRLSYEGKYGEIIAYFSAFSSKNRPDTGIWIPESGKLEEKTPPGMDMSGGVGDLSIALWTVS